MPGVGDRRLARRIIGSIIAQGGRNLTGEHVAGVTDIGRQHREHGLGDPEVRGQHVAVIRGAAINLAYGDHKRLDRVLLASVLALRPESSTHARMPLTA
jgi:hypothetical protein